MPYCLYIHLPFCKRKCPYCNFTSITDAEDIIESYTAAVALEIRHRRSGTFEVTPQTVYLGGGTPSLIPVRFIKNIVRDFSQDMVHEFTVEANPESINERWLDGILDTEVNRISIGFQSLDDSILHNLGRLHNAKQAVLSFVLSRQAGFSDISVDLMFGVPGQTIELWKHTLEEILELQPDHVSGYSLSVEEDTEFYEIMHKEGLQIPEPDKTADMYLLMNEMFEKDGLLRYEISNFARLGHECKHNQGYWNFTPYLGVGSSAHSFDGKIRSWNEPDPVKYINNCFSGIDSTSGFEVIDIRKRAIETVMLSLRTVQGLDMQQIKVINTDTESVAKAKIASFIDSGFLTVNTDGRIVLTGHGAILADEIISEIVCEI